MKKKFKKIYIEITNICNLECPFCVTNKRKNEFMNIDKFKEVISKIKDYTDYIYLHVLGEALLHPNLHDFLQICYDESIQVNLTTNGTLIKKNLDLLLDSPAIRQINISVQALSQFDVDKQKNYLDEIIILVKEIEKCKKIYLSLRFWLGNNQGQDFSKNYLEENLDIKIERTDLAVLDHVYISLDDEFIWPENSDDNSSKFHYCNGIKNQLGILVDGTVVPCCLDANGKVALGNIFTSNLRNILNSKRYLDMLESFSTHKMTEELCLNCSYKQRFLKN